MLTFGILAAELSLCQERRKTKNYDPDVAASPAGLGRDRGCGPVGLLLYRLAIESRSSLGAERPEEPSECWAGGALQIWSLLARFESR